MSMLLAASACVFFAVLLALRSSGPVWDAITSRYIRDLTPLLRALSIEHSKTYWYLRWWGVSLVGTFVFVTFVLRMPPVALALTYLVYVAPRMILQFIIERRRRTIRDQMVSASVALANTTRAGLSLPEGLDLVSREMAPPLAGELQKIVVAYRHGRPLPEAIQETKARLNVDSFSLFASALLVSLERGGRITEALERISHSLTEMQRVERKLEVDTASGRKVVWLLTGFPFFFFGFSHLANPVGTQVVFGTLMGQLVLLVVIGITYVSFRWSQRILAIEV